MVCLERKFYYLILLFTKILTLKEKTEWCIYVNRDVNACKNILLLTKSYLKYQIRPKEFKREDKKNK